MRLETRGPFSTAVYTLHPVSMSLQGANSLLTFYAFPLEKQYLLIISIFGTCREAEERRVTLLSLDDELMDSFLCV